MKDLIALLPHLRVLPALQIRTRILLRSRYCFLFLLLLVSAGSCALFGQQFEGATYGSPGNAKTSAQILFDEVMAGAGAFLVQRP